MEEIVTRYALREGRKRRFDGGTFSARREAPARGLYRFAVTNERGESVAEYLDLFEALGRVGSTSGLVGAIAPVLERLEQRWLVFGDGAAR